MGIVLWVAKSDLFIEAEAVWDAYFALQAWAREDPTDRYRRMILGGADLSNALAALGWEVQEDAHGAVTGITTHLLPISPMRLTVLLALFRPLAPFVRSGSHVVVMHDDGNAALFEEEFTFSAGQVWHHTWPVS